MTEKRTNTPLVSIVIVTYNSSEFILETLESAKAQTYQNIELIVSDDCSSDNTVEVCRRWIDSNKDRFVRTKLVTVDKNSGIAPNFNRGLKALKGEWIKFLAGDDLFVDICVETFINYISNANKNIDCVFSKMGSFTHPNRDLIHVQPSNCDHYFYSDSITAKEQHKLMLTNPGLLFAPSIFVKADLVSEIGGFDEKYRLMEDLPFWLKVTEKNHKIYFIESISVLKRNHGDSTSYSHFLSYNSNIKVINQYNIDLLNFGRDYIYYRVGLKNKIDILITHFLAMLIVKHGNKGKLSWFIFRYFVIIPPSQLISRTFKKIFGS